MAMEDAKTTERETWGNPLEFLLSCISMSVGLGTALQFLLEILSIHRPMFIAIEIVISHRTVFINILKI